MTHVARGLYHRVTRPERVARKIAVHPRQRAWKAMRIELGERVVAAILAELVIEERRLTRLLEALDS